MSGLTSQSKKNFADVLSIMGKNENRINLDAFFNNEKTISTFNLFEKIFKSQSGEIPDETASFDPKRFFHLVKPLGGFNNSESRVYKAYHKLNSHYKQIIGRFGINIIYNSGQNGKKAIINIIKRFSTLLEFSKDSKRLRNLLDALDDNMFDIYLFLYPESRSTDPDRRVQENYDISSGYTSVHIDSKMKNKIMVITRTPDLLGLLTHEMGHLLGWDLELCIRKTEYDGDADKIDTIYTSSGMLGGKKLTDSQQSKIKKLAVGSADFKMNEAFVNTNATIINTMLNSVELSLPYSGFKKLFMAEVYYAIFHTAKILRWNRFKSYRNFFMPEARAILYEQRARLFEYTIIRSFMLLNSNYLIDQYRYSDRIEFSLDDCCYTSISNPDIWKKWDEMVDFIVDKMVEPNGDYEKILDGFMGLIEGNRMNMDYFAIDRDLKN